MGGGGGISIVLVSDEGRVRLRRSDLAIDGANARCANNCMFDTAFSLVCPCHEENTRFGYFDVDLETCFVWESLSYENCRL